MNNQNKKIKQMAVIAITAAVYTVLTLGLAPISYNGLRFAEVMNLLAFINPLYGIGIILGCFMSNIYSPFGLVDVVFGTLASAFAIYMITRTKNLFVATLWPTVSCLLVGIEISLVGQTEIISTTMSVMGGEFLVVTLLGFPIFYFIMKNKRLVYLLSLRALGLGKDEPAQ